MVALGKQPSTKDPLCQVRMCCGLQGGVGVAARSLEGVMLLWLCGDAATERHTHTKLSETQKANKKNNK